MPDTIFRVVLPLFWLLSILGVVTNRWMVRQRLGRDPIVARPWRKTGTAAYLEWTFAICVSIVTIDIWLNAVWPAAMGDTLAIRAVRTSELIGVVGLGLLTVGVVQAGVGIRHMGASWRVGIDEGSAGPLVVQGLFSRARHPIYGGLLLGVTGLAAVTADLLAIGVAVTAWLALPVQARLEEEFLAARHPEAYSAYAAKTRRFWPRWGS